MVDAFKAFALEQMAIKKAYEDTYNKNEALLIEKKATLATPRPVAGLVDATKDGWVKIMEKLEEYNKKRIEATTAVSQIQAQQEDMKRRHQEVLKDFFSASRPLRAAVAKEWMQLVNEGLAKNFLRMWSRFAHDSTVFYSAPLQGELKRLSGLAFQAGKLEVDYDYLSALDSTGLYRAIPYMEGVPDETQRAIICAMHKPVDTSPFSFA